MGATAAKKTRIYIAPDNAGSPGAYVESAMKSGDLDQKADIKETTNFKTANTDGGWKRKIYALFDSSVSLDADYDPAGDPTQIYLRNVSPVGGATAGNQVWIKILFDGINGFQVPCLVESWKLSPKVEDIVPLSVSLTGTGAVTIIGS